MSNFLSALKPPFSKERFWRLFLFTFAGALLGYNLLIIYGYTNPDGIMEGLTYYNNAVVASTMSGRWFVRYLSLLFGNIVNPFLEIVYFSLCTTLSALYLGNLLHMKKDLSYILTSLLFVLCTNSIAQSSYLYMLKAYATCMLFSVLFAYFSKKKDLLSIIIAPLLLALCFALYQSYVGMAAAAVVLRLLSELLIEKKGIKEAALSGIRSLILAVFGGIIYLIGMKIDLAIYGLNSVNRIQEFSLGNILSHLFASIRGTYQSYFNYFLHDYVLKRRYLYLLLFILFLCVFFLKLKEEIKEKRTPEAAASIILLMLLPLFSNLILILIPTNPISNLMNSQNLLFLPLCFALAEELPQKVFRASGYALSIVLLWTLILCANATFRCYQLSYHHINSQMQMVLNDIYHTEGYEKDKTQIVIAGYISDDVLRDSNPLYRYAISLPENVAFWEDTNGVTYNRRNYFLNYFGIDAQIVSEELYYYVIYSDWFKEMNVWPNANSVIFKDGLVVVKLTEDPH